MPLIFKHVYISNLFLSLEAFDIYEINLMWIN